MKKKRRSRTRRGGHREALFVFFVLAVFAAACTPQGEYHQGEAPVRTDERAWPFALLRPGENPLWFELSPDGPRTVSTPGEASLSPFVPWTAARHIRGILPLDSGGLVMAVNRGGFLWTGEWPRPETAAGAETAGDRNGFGGETGLYYRDIPYWEKYTAVSFFFLDERPSVLLSRDDFFSEPSVPVPGSRIWSVNMYSGEPLETGNVFADFPPDAGWDIDALRPGGGGYWYYRAALKNSERPQYHYFHTAALFEKGEEISAARFRSAAEALPPAEAPAPLALLLETAALYAGETARASGAAVPAASVLMTAPGFPAARAFSLSGGAGASLFGFYRPGEIPLAFAFSPEGKGCRLMNGTAEAYSLPSLPEGFVYTGAGADGNTLFASWEEQRDYNIGAAGFMAIRLP